MSANPRTVWFRGSLLHPHNQYARVPDASCLSSLLTTSCTCLSHWSTCGLSILGRVHVAKQAIAASLWYHATFHTTFNCPHQVSHKHAQPLCGNQWIMRLSCPRQCGKPCRAAWLSIWDSFFWWESHPLRECNDRTRRTMLIHLKTSNRQHKQLVKR